MLTVCRDFNPQSAGSRAREPGRRETVRGKMAGSTRSKQQAAATCFLSNPVCSIQSIDWHPELAKPIYLSNALNSIIQHQTPWFSHLLMAFGDIQRGVNHWAKSRNVKMRTHGWEMGGGIPWLRRDLKWRVELTMFKWHVLFPESRSKSKGILTSMLFFKNKNINFYSRLLKETLVLYF